MSDPHDTFFVSTDIGRVVVRGDHMYTEYGEVLPSNAAVRLMPVSADNHENYANWSEDYRHEVRKKAQQEEKRRRAFLKKSADEYRQKQEAEQKESSRKKALVEQARSKLTPEEFKAVYDEGYDEGFENGQGCR